MKKLNLEESVLNLENWYMQFLWEIKHSGGNKSFCSIENYDKYCQEVKVSDLEGNDSDMDGDHEVIISGSQINYKIKSCLWILILSLGITLAL